jgi:hypothetical protein
MTGFIIDIRLTHFLELCHQIHSLGQHGTKFLPQLFGFILDGRKNDLRSNACDKERIAGLKTGFFAKSNRESYPPIFAKMKLNV